MTENSTDDLLSQVGDLKSSTDGVIPAESWLFCAPCPRSKTMFVRDVQFNGAIMAEKIDNFLMSRSDPFFDSADDRVRILCGGYPSNDGVIRWRSPLFRPSTDVSAVEIATTTENRNQPMRPSSRRVLRMPQGVGVCRVVYET